MQKQKILLFGAQGMLGSDIFSLFSEDENFEIIPLSRFNVDITNEKKVREVIEKFSPEIVVNACAYTNVDKCEDERWADTALEVNAIAPEYLAKKCDEENIAFYHFSTDYVFSGEKSDEFSENDIPNPCNVYGAGKLEGEKRVLKYSTARVLRTSWLTGDTAPNFVHKIVHFLKTRPKVSIVDEHGNPSFTVDVALQLKWILENNPEGKIFHLVGEGKTSRKNLAKEIKNFLELDAEIQIVESDYFDLPAKRPKCSALKNTKLPAAQNWKISLHKFLALEKEKLDKKRAIEAKKLVAQQKYREAQERDGK